MVLSIFACEQIWQTRNLYNSWLLFCKNVTIIYKYISDYKYQKIGTCQKYRWETTTIQQYGIRYVWIV